MASLRIPQARIGRTIWPVVQVPFEDQDEQAGAADDVADRVVLSDLAEPDRTKVADRASTARSLEYGIAPQVPSGWGRASGCVTLR